MENIYRKKAALEHTRLMNIEYYYSTGKSVDNTKIYNKDFILPKRPVGNPYIIMDNIDTVSAIFKYKSDDKIAALNFASYKHPGGGFINGSIAQEEALCYSSTLYNVLSKFDDFYEENKNHTNKGLYTNRGLYSPDIIFTDYEKNLDIDCNIITVASPNRSVGLKNKNVTDKENLNALHDRIRFIIDIAIDNNIDTLILGAFGCGVFKQNPNQVADCFKQELDLAPFKAVIFAIPDTDKLNTFKSVFANT